MASANTNTQIVSNASSSNKVYKLNAIQIANKDTGNAATVLVNVYNQAALAGTGYTLGYLSVPASSTLTMLDKGTSIYLMENQSVGINASSSLVNVIASWEEIS